LNSSGKTQLSTTDPDSRSVIFQRTSVKVGYNIQAASDAKHKLLIAADTGDVNDTKALSPVAKQVQCNLKKKKMNVIADKGYHSGRELRACHESGMTTFVSPKQSSSSKKKPAFASTSFKYNQSKDEYLCPAGETLKTNGRSYNKKLKDGKKSYHVKHYKTKACKKCSLRNQCTSNKNGRTIERTEYAEDIERNNKCVNKNPEYYRLRQQIIEHQFGTLKRQWGYDHTHMRGKHKVLGETYLVFTAYNLKRSIQIVGFDQLLKQLKANIRFVLKMLMLHSLSAIQIK